MIDFVNTFKSLTKKEQVCIDNNVFKLHYKLTVIMLIVFTLLLTSTEYFGDPINCEVDHPKNLVNTFCWIYGTYTIKTNADRKILPGLGNDPTMAMKRMNMEIPENLRMYHRYYQWVCIVFCFQSLMFYLPRFLWKQFEAGRLHSLLQNLTDPVLIPSNVNHAKDNLLNYLTCGKYPHNGYALYYCFCEILNLVNLVFQVYFLDWLLMGNFVNYGSAVMQNQRNPMSTVFPKISKCTYYRYGASGSIENFDALCVMPLNNLNEKLFLILWFWLIILMTITIISLLYRFIFLMSSCVRLFLFMGQTNVSYDKLKFIIEKLTFGDVFLLHKIRKNINNILFEDIIASLYDSLNTKNCYKSTRII